MTGWIVYDKAGAKKNRWFLEKLLASGEKRGARMRAVLLEELEWGIRGGKPFVSLPLPDFAVVRTICPLFSEHLEALGVRVYNSARVSALCNDKRRTHLFFASAGIPTMDTFFVQKPFLPPAPLSPCVVKAAGGHGGTDVFWAEEPDAAQQAAQVCFGQGVLFQQPASCLGKDLRVYFCGERLLAAVLRSSASDFRSNFSLGGKPSLYSLSPTERGLAEKAAMLLQADFVGLDFLFHENGLVLNEAEDVVGTRMLYELTDLDAGALLMERVTGK